MNSRECVFLSLLALVLAGNLAAHPVANRSLPRHPSAEISSADPRSETAAPTSNQEARRRSAPTGQRAPQTAYTNISVAQAWLYYETRADVVFLDVREPYERAAGVIPGAILMPWSSGYLSAHHTELPVKPIIVYCRSGGRSASAAQFLVDNGHSNIYNMLGGYTAWSRLPASARRWRMYL